MQNSAHPKLQPISTLILAAGHGGRDSGAVGGGKTEREEAILIVDQAAALLRAGLPGLKVVIAPHEHDTHETLPWIRKRYKFGEAWALEIHRDSADTIRGTDADLRCGIYTGTTPYSRAIGADMLATLLSKGAAPSSWCEPHTSRRNRHGTLAWIGQQNPVLSHLVELGFMEGKHDPAHLTSLATLLAHACGHAIGGTDWKL